MAKQDDRNRDAAVDAVDQLYSRIEELEKELSSLQDRYDELEKKCDSLEDEIIDLMAREE